MSLRSGYLVMGLCVLLCGRARGQTTERVSVSSSGAQANGHCEKPSISADGRFVSFCSEANTLVPVTIYMDWEVYVHDRQSGTTEIMSVDANGVPGNHGSSTLSSISADGRFVAFQSDAINLVPNDTNVQYDIFVRDRQLGTIERVSVSSGGAEADDGSFFPSISADGRYVAFMSYAGNLVPGAPSGQGDIYVRDRLLGTTELVSVDSSGGIGNGGSAEPSLSADGRTVAFWSSATNLVLGDTNGWMDTFVHDRLTGATERVSVDSNGIEGNLQSRSASVSGDGRYVAFFSMATNFAPGAGGWDVYVRDRLSGTTTWASFNRGDTPSISADGRFVAYHRNEVFVYEQHDGMTWQASVSSNGTPSNGFSNDPSISADGHWTAFSSSASNLVGGDSNGVDDIFVHEFGPVVGTPFCFGDGTGAACPCGNSGRLFRGCENSDSTGGAVIRAVGLASLSNDTLQITSFGEKGPVLSAFFQGDATIAPGFYGDGLRCIGGTLKRLYVRNASFGVVSAPQGTDLSVSARSAALGDTIPIAGTRFYQVQYRDRVDSFCPNPPGNTWNASNALQVVWNP